MIKITVNQALDVTIFTATSSLTVHDFGTAIHDAYSVNPTSNAIWDLTTASVSNITVDSLNEILRQSDEFAPYRINPRSIIVPGDIPKLIMTRLFQAITDYRVGKVKIEIADNIEEAYKKI
ncbi:MAG: hypothetical protein P1V34_01325 [Alphaproteobacteria bacterium]|nr:hypothetical protein [Alphaproteobacteria bacterium]